MNTPEETLPKLGLADLDFTEIPHLEVVVRNSKQEVVANVGASIVALISNPQHRVLYLEAVSTSDSGAHAVMGAVSDPRGAVEFRFYRAGTSGDYVEITPPESPRVANVRIEVSGWGRRIHHIAMLDHSGQLLLAPDNETLWRKLQEIQSCPCLECWGEAVMKEVHQSGMLLECEAFGVPQGLRAFVLAPEAEAMFDAIIARHVRSTGIPRRTAA